MRSLHHWRLGLAAGWLATTVPVALAQEAASPPPAEKKEAPATKSDPASKADDAARAVIEDLLSAQRAKKANEAKKDPGAKPAGPPDAPHDPIGAPAKPAPVPLPERARRQPKSLPTPAARPIPPR